MAPSLTLEELTLRLFEVEGLKFGQFTVRTGEISPVYIDMRVIWSYPDIVRAVCDHLWEELRRHEVAYDMVCGIPYQGIPLATFFRNEKLDVSGAVTFFDREQGGRERIQHITGVHVYCCLTLSKAFEFLLKHNKVSQELADQTMEYLKTNRFDTPENGVTK